MKFVRIFVGIELGLSR